jgi:predicted nucleotidyltransferase component of viral defense system
MPRLSVDIDLAYLPIEDRDTSLAGISSALDRIAASIEKTSRDLRVQRTLAKGTQRISKLIVASREVQVKVEPNEVIRGFVFDSIEKDLCSKAEELFEKSVSIMTLSFADLYGGKLCAALDRQHPRDLFDMKILLENEGLTDEIRKAFLVYLSSHDRPINEMIEPTRKDIKQDFERAFTGMVATEVTLKELLAVREQYISVVAKSLTQDERRFLISLKEGEPEWTLLGIKGIENLPAVQWKLQNIRSLKEKDGKKHKASLAKLKKNWVFEFLYYRNSETAHKFPVR